MGETYRSSQSSKTPTEMTKNASFFFRCNQKKNTKKHQYFLRNLHLPSTSILQNQKKNHSPNFHLKTAVQVVGRFIQQQNVAISHHCLGAPKWELETVLNVPFIEWWMPSSRSQQQFHAPTTAKFIHLPKMRMQSPQVRWNVAKESVCVRGVSDVSLCLSLRNVSPNLDKQSTTKWEEEKSSTKN